MKLSTHVFDTPVAPILVAVDAKGAVHRLELLPRKGRGARRKRVEAELARGGFEIERDAAACERVERAVRDYLAGSSRALRLKLAPRGTPFQRSVWDELRRIPFGATRSYGDVARAIGRPTAVRAVARANATNPIALAIPCHRVIGSDGSLTGYGGGIDRKRRLLELEGALLPSRGGTRG